VYDWPGNVRELKAVVEQAAILADGDVVSAKEVRIAVTERSGAEAPVVQLAEVEGPGELGAGDGRDGSLPSIERAMIVDAFQSAHGNVSEAARQLGIPRSTLRDKLKRIGLVA
jgi:two-component system NtrC family response regulator